MMARGVLGVHQLLHLTNKAVFNRVPLLSSSLSGCRRYTNFSGSDSHEVKRERIIDKLKPAEYFNLTRDIVAPWAEHKPSHPALLVTDGHNKLTISYHTLVSEAKRFASALSNPRPPALALVLLPKVPQWWVVNLAGAWCGTIICPGVTQLTAKDVSYRIKHSGADCIICTADLAQALDTATRGLSRRILVSEGSQCKYREGWERYEDLMNSSEECNVECVNSKGSDVAQLFFTSGTTGRPKMVPHTHGSYGVGHITTSWYWLDLCEDDLVWNISDTGWAKAAWSSLYAPIMAGATAFVHQMARFNAEEMLQALRDYPVSVLCAPPTVYRALVQGASFHSGFPSLRHCVSAGEPLNPEVMYEWTKVTGLSIYEGFGQTETTLLACVVPGMRLRPGSMGKPAPGYDLKVVDDSCQELGPHQEGDLAINLKNSVPVGLFRGYLNDEAKSQEMFVGGYYLTGDKAYYDEDGYFWFIGRSDDVIISSGYRIGPFEVESCLLEHPAVAESAVVSSPDSLRGEVVKAFVILAEGYKDADHMALVISLQQHVKENTAPYKYPRMIEIVETLPKTVSGKIRRVELRNKEWGQK
ncbi:hypothetical protein Pcinc_020710 [Petrolisthes cinctipes]|uniref:medium-chain acyl-CoA ligase n=1 Tax=Petrolisthes cinctipes TaxID=88211 RepID=A0AAE1FHF9_PETCI|nr:hypothetical protein Pcinc_020710 [Petrolisthes cinctipes]